MAIAKYIADSHGGKIEVESQLGIGTTFNISIPLKNPEPIAM
jgi:signal transduction histidine kinase